jgi:hypothetical protein
MSRQGSDTGIMAQSVECALYDQKFSFAPWPHDPERAPEDPMAGDPPLVELRGIEPLTSSLRTTRSPS